MLFFFFSSRRRHTRLTCDWSSDVCSSDLGADGVQRTATSLTVEDIRALADKRLRIGASIHSLPDALQAELEGADWLVFGPVYDTPSKRMYGPPQGLDKLARVAAAVRIPVIAIGG